MSNISKFIREQSDLFILLVLLTIGMTMISRGELIAAPFITILKSSVTQETANVLEQYNNTLVTGSDIIQALELVRDANINNINIFIDGKHYDSLGNKVFYGPLQLIPSSNSTYCKDFNWGASNSLGAQNNANCLWSGDTALTNINTPTSSSYVPSALKFKATLLYDAGTLNGSTIVSNKARIGGIRFTSYVQ
jgi:hypothetical protein